MNDKNKISIRVFVLCLSLIVIDTFAFSYIYHNGSTGGYTVGTQPPGIPGISGIQSNVSMEILVTEGAGYFIKAHSNIQSLLNILEWQDIKTIDYLYLKHLIESSLISINKARTTFEDLIKIAEGTPYNLEVTGNLSLFDYENLMKKNDLNPFIFGIVREYLVKSDITGTYKYSYEHLKEIEQLLRNIQSSISVDELPELAIFWRVNELCAEETLFGSYIARIFNAIK